MRTPRARRRLAVEALEDRTVPDAAGTLPFTSTEVLVGVRGADPLGLLAGFATDNGHVAAADSKVILTTADGVSLVEARLAPGADPRQTVTLLAAQSWAAWAEPNTVVAPGAGRDWTPNDPSYTAAGQYFHTKSQTNLAWDITKGSSTILVGVTDDGLGYNHPDLAGNVWTNPGEVAGNGVDDDGNGFVDDVRGWDFNTSDNDPLPAGSDSHGTHVGGIIAARSNNGVGVAGTAGGDGTAGSGVRLVGLRWDGTNSWTAARVAAAYTYAANNGVRVVNSSYNFDGFATNSTVTTALDYAYNAGVLLMLSAGNNAELDAARGVLTQPLFVASLDQNDARSSFSNYGTYVDLAGHGSSILSTTTNTSGTGVNYEIYSGTSMSTPHAAGVAALIWSVNPTWTRDQVAAQMLGTTDNIYAVAGNLAGTLGTGRVNAFRALTQTLAAPVFTDFTLTGPPGAVQAVTVTVPRRLLPAAVVAANFELRGNGPDNAFGTADDVLVPVTVNGGAAYRMGTNTLRLAPTAGGVLPADRYRLTAFAGATRLRDPFGTPLDGNANGTGGDDYVVEFGAEPALAGRVYEDWAGNATADANDPGVAGRQVYLDANGNASFDATLATTPFASGTINLAIPDNNPTGVTNTRAVSGLAGVVTKVTVTLNVTHPYDADLTIDLTGPSGATVALVTSRGGSGDNFTSTVLDDAGATAIGSGSAPFTGTFRPESPLSALAGGTANGNWSLRVRDLGPDDLGTLVNWTLTLTTGEQAVTTTAAGAYGFGSLAAGTYTVRTTSPAGWSPTGPAGGAHTQTIAAGGSVAGLDFGTVRQNAVYGQMVNDLNGNGVRDGGEPVLAGWRVFDDRDNDGVRDAGEVNALTDASGNYVLPGLAAGATTFRVERQAGYRTTLGVAGLPLTVAAGSTYHARDFGAVADSTAPTADVTDVTPDPRTSSVSSLTIVFSEAVTGFDLADLALRRDGGSNLLTGSQALTTSDNITWTLGNLAGLTGPVGTYVLTLTAAGSGVQDAAQNALAANASDTWAVVPAAAVSVSDVSLGEAGGPAVFTVSLSAGSSDTITVPYSTADGTATVADSDYTAAADTLTFLPGETTKQVSVPVANDARDEADETFVLNLGAPTNATVADGQGVATITDDDPLPALSIDSVTLTEGNSGNTAFVFTVTLSAVSGRAVSVNYATANGTATTADGDYTAASGTLTFLPGETTKAVAVQVTGDVRDEADETFTVGLSGAANATVTTATGTGTITDDDPLPTLSISPWTQSEGTGGTSGFLFTVTLSAASGRTVTVSYSTADGTATAAGGDFIAAAGIPVVFAPGETSKIATVQVIGDVRDEPDETFAVTLSGATNATISSASATGTIVDDDPTPSLSINSPSLAEGGGSFGFAVTLSAASGRTVTVNYGTADGTATAADGDYTAASGTLTFAPGETAKTVSVPVANDARDEADETLTVTLSGAANASITTAAGTGTITDDDPTPTLTIVPATRFEGSIGTTPFVFAVTLSAASGRPVTVNYATADGTATTADGDYTAASGTLTFLPGETAKSITVQVAADTRDEPDEGFAVALSGETNAGYGTQSAAGSIADDDPTPTLAINGVTLAEGTGGNTAFAFTVTLSAVSGRTVAVNYATADGTATAADGDYTAASGTLTFAPGETTKTVTVPVTADARDEDDETFVLNLSGAANATIATATATGTITDDDPLPGLSIDSVTLAEGTGGTTPFVFTVTLSAVSGRAVTVNYATANGTATVPDGDYAAAGGTLTFAPGETTKTITVQVAGDARDEINETFAVNLSGATNATVTAATGPGTVADDDPTPTLAVNSVTLAEGNSGTTPFAFTVTLSAVSGRTVTVNYATADGTAAVAGGDYTSASGTLTFAPGETTKTVTVQAAGDARNEDDETFVVNLSGAANATVTVTAATGTGTVTNDDPLPALSVASVTQAEGTGGTTTFVFTVTLSAVSGRTVTVGYATADDTATTADGDYTAAGGTLTFAPGVTTRTFTVAVAGDARNEDDETFGVGLSGATNATIGAASATGTITDDDPLPTLGVNSVSLPEGTGGPTGVAFTVSLSAVSGRTVTVAYATADGTATAADGDYTAATGGVTFAPGETTKTVTVQAAGDARNEDDETFALQLGAAANAVVAAGTGTGTLVNDDPVPTLAIGSRSAAEGDGGTTAFTFTVTLSAVSGKTVTVNYATADGSARATDGDYAPASGALAFAPGVTTRTFTVAVAGDVRNEIDETFVAVLSGAANATIAAGTGTATLVNDDPEPTLSVNSVSAAEGDAGPVGLAYTVSLSAVSGRTVTVNYATADGTATAGSDYAAAGGTLTFAPGETTKTVAVTASGDDTFEPDETFTLNLGGAANAGVAAGTGTGTVANDDAVPTATLSGGGSVAEAGGSATFVVTLSNPSYLPVFGALTPVGGTASATDFTVSTPPDFVIPAGQLSTTVTVTASSDDDDEPDETVTLLLGTANAGVGSGPVELTITDDDVPEAASAGFDLAEDTPFAAPTSLLAGANAQPGSVVELVGAAPAGGTLTLNPDGTFSFTPAADAHGTVGFDYRVRNPAGEVSAPAVVALRVAAVNDPPAFAAGPDQTDPRRGGPRVVPGWATAISAGPPDESGQRLTFEVSTDNPGLFAVQPAIDPATGTLTYTPGAGFGRAVVTVRLSDDGGGADAAPARAFGVEVLKYRDDNLPTNQDEVGLIGVGSGDGGTVAAFRGDGAVAGALTPFTGASARVVTADVTGDGVADTIAATGPGVRSRVVVIDGATGAVARTLLPFEDSFTGGLFVAAADVDGDGKAEIAVSPDTGGGGRVTVYGAAGVVADFFGIDDRNFRGGARVTFGDVNGDGTPELVVVAGFGGGPRTAIYDGLTLRAGPARLVNDFFAFPGSDAVNLRNGVFVAAGDVDGDGFADLAFGGGPGGAPRVFVLSGALVSAGRVAAAQAAPIGNFFVAGNTSDRGGVRVAVKDADGDDRADVAAGSGEGSAARVRVYAGSAFGGGGEPGGFFDLEPFGGAVLVGGVYVG